jgi:hypothetical protein
MTRLSRFFILILWAAIVPFFILWPAYAQAPCGEAGDYYLINNWSVAANTSGITWSANGDNWNVDCDNCGNADPNYSTLEADYSHRVHTGDVLYLYFNKNTSNNAMEVRGRILLSSGDVITGTWKDDASFPSYVTVTVPEDYDGFLVDQIFIDVSTFRGPAFGESYTFYPASSYFTLSCPDIGGGAACALIQNADFYASDGWYLSNEAVITDGVATIPQTGIVAQNLTLESYTAYNAIISTTNTVTTPGQLAVTLGGDTVLLDITEPGVYTASFTTTLQSGIIIYGLTTITELPIFIDYTCISLGTDSSGENDCLAPTNGTFDTAQNWYWYRNAAWEQFSKMAAFPYNGGDAASLIQTSISYTMPTLTGTQYLILGYQAQAADTVGLIGSRVGTSENEQQLHAAPYDYEVDISTQAGQLVDVAFADSGTSDLLLDNVCIFLSDTPPDLPAPSDPDGIGGGVDFGFNYTCRDVPAILAGFGINVYGAEATFEAGVSVWEPQNYIPWLAAALWSNAARPITCLIIEEMRLIAGVTQQQINEFLNVSNWFIRSTRSGVIWLHQGFLYLKNTFFGVAQFAQTAASGWLNWFSRAARDFWNNGQIIASNLLNDASNTFIRIWNESVLPVLQLYISSFSTQVDVNQNPGGLPGFGLIDFIWAIFSLLWWLGVWIWENVIMVGSLPITFYRAFDSGLNATGYSLISCSGQNFWCAFLSGVQLINQLAGHTILYPAVILGIIVGSLVIFWTNIMELFSIEIR